ncbi:hypothetical protein KUV95_07100 [Microbulbifer agarilyticus]|uniref:putative glycoside hydrolase n=1 Tax=Microbulbifer agarilyticus TaxID=260552 RepID=UPI001C976770|nr:putative glycoside hydrolase [Microbulbifer agarilyticus]MBY6211315.1 hypothetical protein [Microbulbifer agarilyticus]
MIKYFGYGFALACALSSGVSNAGTGDIANNALGNGVLLSGGAVGDPWKFYVGNPTNWHTPVRGDSTNTRSPKNVQVDFIEDAIGYNVVEAKWRSGSTGQILWQSKRKLDLEPLAAEGGSLSLVLRVDEAPSDKVTLRMDCGYPCAGSFKLGQILTAVPQKQWFHLAIPLSCFADAGTKLSKVDAPLVVITNGSMGISLADVRLVTNAPESSTISCST